MPQKKNPDLLELVRGKAARLLGNQVALAANLKGLPLAYNKDMQETQEPLLDSCRTILDCVRLMERFVAQVEFDHARMQQAAKGAFMNAFAAATYLARKGVPFRLAHEQIGQAVRLCLAKGCALEELSLAELRTVAPAAEEDIFAALTLSAVLAAHDVEGGTAPHRVAAALAEAKQHFSGAMHASA